MISWMRRGLQITVVTLALMFGCETSGPRQPSPDAQPAPAPVEPTPVEPTPAEPAPAPEPMPSVEPVLDLPAVAGVHYLEVVTGGAEPDAELPMIIALHGNGAYPALMAEATLELPGTKNHPATPYDAPARFIFLRGTQPFGGPGHARWFSIKAADAQKNPRQLAALAVQIEDRSHTVAAAIAALLELRPTKGKPIITGHSQGAILTFGLAIFHPELFELAIPMAGWLPQPLWPKQGADASAKQLRIVALHGTADAVVDFRRARDAVTQLAALGWSIELHPYPGVKHAISPLLAELRALLRETTQAEPAATPGPTPG